ncbi:MAG TPA: XdhC family protein [Puia sp.]|nr:XdhC family protein [Puia sp.]
MLPDKGMSLWRLALSSLQRNIPVLLLYVVESKGSSPGRHGFFMVVNREGETEGSIGGGIMEYKFLEMAREMLRRGAPVLSVRRQVHDKEVTKDQSGMICSGEQTILLYTLRAGDKSAIGLLLESLESNGNGCLRLSPEGIGFSAVAPEAGFYFEKRSEDDWVYLEKTGYVDQLYIIGGGHCALALSRIAQTMDFYITLFDDRSGLESVSRNEYVHEKILVGDYGELGELVKPGLHSYVVVMTQGYRTDDRAVRVLLPMELRYFGLLGSKAKIGKMVADYRSEGIREEWLGRMRAPAGLSIQSQTPEEIAVSIMAEVIQARHR